jgi:hypothetical protein
MGCQKPPAAPRQLQGVWKNTSSLYADRFLEFYASLVIFGTGNCGEEVNHLQQVTLEPLDGQNIRYHIDYRDQQGERWKMSLTYSPEQGGLLRLPHRSENWTRVQKDSVVRDMIEQNCT